MVLKYGEIYVHHNQNEELFTNGFWRFFGWETYVDKSSKILIMFTDKNELFDANEYLLANDRESILIKIIESTLPVPDSFTNTLGEVALYKQPININGIKKLCFENIFVNYEKFKTIKRISSIFNCIYIKSIEFPLEVFGIVRVLSAENTPRFIFAFESDFMSETNAIYFANWVLRGGEV